METIRNGDVTGSTSYHVTPSRPIRSLENIQNGEIQACLYTTKVAELCSEMKIKMVRSRPYHPQAQGNVERSHRTLRRRMLFDLLHNSKKRGMNWVQKLQEYAQVMNNGPEEVLRWQTPFRVYYGRNYNSKRSLDLSTQNIVHVENRQTSCPSLDELSSYSNNRKCIRRNAKLGTKQCAEKMMRRSAKNVPEYAIGDEVIVRYKLKRGKTSRMHISEGIIKKKGKRSATYQIQRGGG